MARTALMLPCDLRRGAGEVGLQCGGVGIDAEARRRCLRWAVGDAVVVQEIFCGEVAGGQRAELGANQALGVVEQLVAERAAAAAAP